MTQKGRDYADQGDLRFAAELLNHAVFAAPDDTDAKEALASVYDRLGYGAENGTWRNFYLTGAAELRGGIRKSPIDVAGGMASALSVEQLFDSIAIRIDGPKAWDLRITIDWVFTDLAEEVRMTLSNGVLVHGPHKAGDGRRPHAHAHEGPAARPARRRGPRRDHDQGRPIGAPDRPRCPRPSGPRLRDRHAVTVMGRVVVCLPDVPERRHMGELPANVDVVLASPEDGPIPDLAAMDLVIPIDRLRRPLIDTLATVGRPRIVQTLSAGVDWLVGHVPEGVTVCNARGVFDVPLAEWVVGAILGMERGLIQARDAQATHVWTSLEPRELAGRRVVILGHGSIGTAIADRLRPFGVEIVGVARTARDGVLGMDDLDDVLPTAEILVDMLPLTSETLGLLDARRLAPPA